MARPRPRAGPAWSTEVELEVLQLIAPGYKNPEIAAQLYLAAGTVRNDVSVILQKLGVEDRTQAAAVPSAAQRSHNWAPPPPARTGRTSCP